MPIRMATMTINRFVYLTGCFLLLFFVTPDLQGQLTDFQSWWELKLDKKLSGKLDLNGEIEQRFKNNSLQYNRTLLTLGASYEPADYFSLAGGARMVFLRNPEQGLETRYRIHMDGTGSYDVSGFDLSLRLRLQYGFDEFLALRYFRFNALVNRNRLKVAHHFFGTRFDGFASVESWHGSSNESRWLTFAFRYSAGLRFSPGFKSRFSLQYILEDEFNVSYPRLLHVIVLGYNYRF